MYSQETDNKDHFIKVWEWTPFVYIYLFPSSKNSSLLFEEPFLLPSLQAYVIFDRATLTYWLQKMSLVSDQANV